MSTGSKIIGDLEEVNILDDKDQFLFFQNSTKKTKRVTKGNMANSGGGLRGKFIDAATGNDVGITAATATTNAATALVSANGAQVSANGKNQIYYATTSPTASAIFTASISGTVLTVTAMTSGTITIGKVITNAAASISEGTTVTAFVSGTNGGAGVYTISPSNSTIGSGTIYSGFNYDDLWFDTDGGYRMAKWNGASWADYGLGTQSIANLDAGKITAGFIGSQVVAINGTNVYGDAVGAGGYIESTSFVLTWPGANLVDVKIYNGSATNLGKDVASDVVQVKVLQADGSYKLYRSIANQPKSPSQVGPPNATYWTEITGGSIPTFTVPINSTESATIQNFGFRIASNGFAEFAGGLFRGAVIANEGYFGTASNAVRIDTTGLLIGGAGRIKSSTLTWNENSTNPTGGTGGFFLGYRNSQYQFFIGDQSGNYLRWDGSALKVNGNIVGGSTVGTGSTDVGLVMNTQFGIRRSVDDGTLTLTGGNGNGVYFGAQIDLVGSIFKQGADLSGDDGSGELVLSAGYRTGSTYDGPLDGAIIFRTLREENNLDSGNDAHSGAQRFRIELDGTVRVVYTGNATSNTDYGKVYYGTGAGVETGLNTNPGRFLVEGSSGTKEVQIKDGKIEFSSAANTYDTNLFRHAADQLGTDDDIVVGVGTTRYLYFYRTGAQIVWPSSDGSFTGDTVNLRKGGTNLLKTDDDFEAVSLTSTSTRREKKNIKKYKAGLEIVEKLRPVSYKRKSNNQDDIGFIAEEVNEILPIIVRKDEENIPQSMDYSKLTVILVNAVKELSAEIKELKKKLKDANTN